MKFSKICALVLATASVPAFAGSDLSQVQNLSQSEFASLAQDFTAAASYKGVAPAAPLGLTGFDLGLEVSATQLQNTDAWSKAGYDHSSLPMPKLSVAKGLPFGVDLGASITGVPGSDIKLVGAEIKYAFIPGGVATPALAIRAAATRLYGVDQLDLNTRSLELLVSKGFLMLTPYAGVGKVWGNVTPNVSNLQKESTDANKLFAGVNFNLGLVNIATEADRTGDNKSVSVKFGFRW